MLLAKIIPAIGIIKFGSNHLGNSTMNWLIRNKTAKPLNPNEAVTTINALMPRSCRGRRAIQDDIRIMNKITSKITTGWSVSKI